MCKRGWISSLSGLIWILCTATTLLAQEVVKTKDGREVLLKPDGTWVYITEQTPQGKASGVVPPSTQANALTPTAEKNTTVRPAGTNTAPTTSATPDKVKTANPTPAPGNVDTGKTTPTGKEIYQGPRGGCYHYSKSGKKVYAPCS